MMLGNPHMPEGRRVESNQADMSAVEMNIRIDLSQVDLLAKVSAVEMTQKYVLIPPS